MTYKRSDSSRVSVVIPLGAAWACLLGYGVLAATSTVWTNRELRKQAQ